MIFYDPLLTFLKKYHEGFVMTATTTHYLHNYTLTANASALAFVDNLTHITKNKGNLEAITKDALVWIEATGLQVNVINTKLLVVNEDERTLHEPFIFDEKSIPRTQPENGERLLGIHLSSDMKFTTQKDIIENEVKEFINQLQTKSITDQMCAYLINKVLIPSFIYRNKLAVLNDANIYKIETKIRTFFAHKAGHSSRASKALLQFPRIYNLYQLREEIRTDLIFTYQKMSNTRNWLARSPEL
jgi:hypothetical protein